MTNATHRPLQRLALALALLAPLAAGAITVTSPQSSSSTTGAVYVGQAACNANTTYSFNYTLDQLAVGDTIAFAIVHGNSDCNTFPVAGAGDQQVGSPSQTTTTGTYATTAGALALAQTADGGFLGCTDTTHTSASPYTTYFCVQDKPASTLTTTTPTFGSIAINFSMVPPTEPASVGGEGGDSHVKVSWAAGNSSETILTYQVFAVAQGGTVDPNGTVSGSTSGLSIDVQSTQDGSALANGKTYDIYVRAQDIFSNYSALAGPISATPLAVDDFFNYYRSRGGSAVGGGGCSTGGSGLGALGLVLALMLCAGLWARRRRLGPGRGARGFFAGLFGLALVFAAPSAQAQSQYGAPPRWLMISLKLDRYDPKVDSEADLNGATPYLDIFGTRKPFRFQIEGDWEIAHPLGSFLLGVSGGYWQNIGKGVIATSISGTAFTPSTDTALLDILPFGLVATYRFDYLADRLRWFPLVPYAQVGLSTALWASFNGTGSVSHYQGGGGNGRGSGWTYGYTTALGLALALDALDPSLSREAYNDTYLQRTSVFAEYGWTRLDDFGHKHPLILTDRAWRFGLSLEF